MIIKNGTNAKVEQQKKRLNLTGDVYVYEGHFMESLESHKKLLPNSTATTIQEAYTERVAYEFEQEKLRLEQQKEHAEEDVNVEEE